MENKKFLAFPVLSGFVTMIVMLTFALPQYFSTSYRGVITSIWIPRRDRLIVVKENEYLGGCRISGCMPCRDRNGKRWKWAAICIPDR
jgi:hypothetical protein